MPITSVMRYWPVPDSYSKDIPRQGPGSFAENRQDRIHSGVDIYAPEGAKVVAIENGLVIAQGIFTSPKLNPYWNKTYYVAIKTNSNFINKFCELKDVVVEVGDNVKGGQLIGHIGVVLNFRKINEDSPLYIQKLKAANIASMLHFELYLNELVNSENYFSGNWLNYSKMPKNLLDPTRYLLSCRASVLERKI
ncbi:MAG: M23 family metallopeptidase [Candidatus Pacearchaeota archaeon]